MDVILANLVAIPNVIDWGDNMNIKFTKDQELKDKILQYIKENGECPNGLQCLCQNIIDQGVGPCKCGLYIKTEV